MMRGSSVLVGHVFGTGVVIMGGGGRCEGRGGGGGQGAGPGTHPLSPRMITFKSLRFLDDMVQGRWEVTEEGV